MFKSMKGFVNHFYEYRYTGAKLGNNESVDDESDEDEVVINLRHEDVMKETDENVIEITDWSLGVLFLPFYHSHEKKLFFLFGYSYIICNKVYQGKYYFSF